MTVACRIAHLARSISASKRTMGCEARTSGTLGRSPSNKLRWKQTTAQVVVGTWGWQTLKVWSNCNIAAHVAPCHALWPLSLLSQPKCTHSRVTAFVNKQQCLKQCLMPLVDTLSITTRLSFTTNQHNDQNLLHVAAAHILQPASHTSSPAGFSTLVPILSRCANATRCQLPAALQLALWRCV